MSLRRGAGLDKWETAAKKKLMGEFRRRWPIRWRQDFDELVQDCLLDGVAVSRKLAHKSDDPKVAYMTRDLRKNFTELMRGQRAKNVRGTGGVVLGCSSRRVRVCDYAGRVAPRWP